jgi:hypothetical protein
MNFSFRQYLDHEARVAKGRSNGQPAPPVTQAAERERALHDDIQDECKRRRWLCLHGSMAHKTMRTVGEPDFTILADVGRVFFVECKTATGKLSPEQLALKCWAEMLGHEIHIVRSLDEFLKIVGPGKGVIENGMRKEEKGEA